MKICVFGDSVTYAGYIKDSWFNLLKTELESKFDDVEMFNLGINGDTSDDILKRFQIEAAARNPDKIIFAFGINDSGYIFDTKESLVTEENFKSNIIKLMSLTKEFTNEITFVGLVLGDDSLLKPYPESSSGKSYNHTRAESYDLILKDLATQNKHKYIYLYDKLNFNDFADGLHPNENGHNKMYEIIRKQIL